MSGSSLMRYAKFSQDASRVATWTVTSGGEDSEYPATNLNGYDLTAPAKLTSGSGIWKADLSAQPAYSSLVGVALIHCNLEPGIEVRLQGDNDPAFGSLDFNQRITIPALSNNWPVNGYLLFAATDLDYWRINVVGTNPVDVSIGHIALLTAVNLIPGAQQGLKWTRLIPTWDDVTEMEVPMNLDLLTLVQSCQFNTMNVNGAQTALDDWFLDARGINLPFLFIPNVNVNDCFWMTFAEKAHEVIYQSETPGGSIRLLQVSLKEFGRGMLPTPWLV